MFGQLFGTCRLHKTKLLEEEVPIRYGLIRFSSDYIQARRQLFPNAMSFVLGGCRVSPANPKIRKVKYCSHCREAEKAWHQAHATK